MKINGKYIHNLRDYKREFSFCAVWSDTWQYSNLVNSSETLWRDYFSWEITRLLEYYNDVLNGKLNRKYEPEDIPEDEDGRRNTVLKKIDIVFTNGKKCGYKWKEPQIFFEDNKKEIDEITDHWKLIDNSAAVDCLCMFLMMHMQAEKDIGKANGDEAAVSEMRKAICTISKEYDSYEFRLKASERPNVLLKSQELVIRRAVSDPLILPLEEEVSSKIAKGIPANIARIRNASDQDAMVFLGEDTGEAAQYRRIEPGETIFALRQSRRCAGFLPRFIIENGNVKKNDGILVDEEGNVHFKAKVAQCEDVVDISVFGDNYCMLRRDRAGTLCSNMNVLNGMDCVLRAWLGGHSAIIIDRYNKLKALCHEVKEIPMPKDSMAVDARIYDDHYIWLDAKRGVHAGVIRQDGYESVELEAIQCARCVSVGKTCYVCTVGDDVVALDFAGKIIQRKTVGPVCEMLEDDGEIYLVLENQKKGVHLSDVLPQYAAMEFSMQVKGLKPISSKHMEVVIRGAVDRPLILPTKDAGYSDELADIVYIRNAGDQNAMICMGEETGDAAQYRWVAPGETVFVLHQGRRYAGFLPRFSVQDGTIFLARDNRIEIRGKNPGSVDFEKSIVACGHAKRKGLISVDEDGDVHVKWSKLALKPEHPALNVSTFLSDYCVLLNNGSLCSSIDKLNGMQGVLRVWMGLNGAIILSRDNRLKVLHDDELKEIPMSEDCAAVDARYYDGHYIWLDADRGVHADVPLEIERARCIAVGSMGYACSVDDDVVVIDFGGKVVQRETVGPVCEMVISDGELYMCLEEENKIVDLKMIQKARKALS